MGTRIQLSPAPGRKNLGQFKGICHKRHSEVPVNPRPDVKEIRGLKVYPMLNVIDRPVDMVEVFRRPEDLMGIAEDAIAIGARVLWGQIGVVDHKAARLAEDAGLKVVMNRCPKIELFRPFWQPKLNLSI